MFKIVFLSFLIVLTSSSLSNFRKLKELILMSKTNSQYLKATKNCHVGSPEIKKQAESWIKGAKTPREKALRLYNFVRDKIEYEKYSNTRYGSLKTLKIKKGNCVDQHHLLNALLRTVGIPARYKNGYVVFRSSGLVGHVWTYAFIDGKWRDLDTTHRSNSFDKIYNWTKAKSSEILTAVNF